MDLFCSKYVLDQRDIYTRLTGNITLKNYNDNNSQDPYMGNEGQSMKNVMKQEPARCRRVVLLFFDSSNMLAGD